MEIKLVEGNTEVDYNLIKHIKWLYKDGENDELFWRLDSEFLWRFITGKVFVKFSNEITPDSLYKLGRLPLVLKTEKLVLTGRAEEFQSDLFYSNYQDNEGLTLYKEKVHVWCDTDKLLADIGNSLTIRKQTKQP